MFINHSQSFRPLIEKTVKKWKSLTPSQRIGFYDEVIDLESLLVWSVSLTSLDSFKNA